MFDGVFQLSRALLMLQGGIWAGLIYWGIFPLRRLLRRSFIAIIFIDILTVLLIGGVFMQFCYVSSHLQLDFYAFLCFAAGFLLHFFNIRYIINSIIVKKHGRKGLNGNGQEEKGYKQVKKEKA